MSYDVSIAVPSGPGATVTAFDSNYTSNCSRMWAHALDLPDRPLYNDDGSRRTYSRYSREAGEWESNVPYDAWGIAVLDGAPCSEAAGVLSRAVRRMEADPDTYRQWEPANGWGDYEGALDFLRSIAEAASTHSAGTLAVHH